MNVYVAAMPRCNHYLIESMLEINLCGVLGTYVSHVGF